MRKGIVILAVLLTLTVPLLGQPSPSVPMPAQHPETEKRPIPGHVAVDSMPARDGYEWAAYWGNVALVLVAFGGVLVGACSLVFLRRQTEATRIAADAALAQANHIANSERAWIEVLPYNWSIEFYPKWETGDPVPEGPMGTWPISHRFAAQIKNLGRTPAKIEGITVRYVRTSRSARDMDPEPDFGEIDTEQFFLLPNSEMAATAILSPESGVLTKAEVTAIQDGKEFLYAYGVVKYRDVYDRSHETHFGYAYRTPDSHYILKEGKIETISFGKAVFQHAGPAAYNLVT